VPATPEAAGACHAIGNAPSAGSLDRAISLNIQVFTFAGPTRGRRGLTGRDSAGLSPAMSRSLPPSILDPSTLGLAVVTLLAACSATSPPSQYPPPGPSGGLPYIPFPKKSIFDEVPSESAEQPAAAAKPSVISGDLPDKPPAALSRKASCTDKVCTLETWLPDPTFAKSVDGGKPAPTALWLESIKKGSTVVLPRHDHLDVLAVDLAGQVIANSDDGKEVRNLDVWSALRVPGAGCALRAKSDAKIALAIATDEPTLDAALAAAKAKPWKVRWHKRPGKIESVDLAKAKDLAWGGGAFHARLAFGGAGDNALRSGLELLMMSPDAPVPEHDHADSWETLGALGGDASMKLDGNDYPVKPGSIFQIPKGAKHSVTPGHGAPLLAIQLYTPSGPEQRFVKLAGGNAKKAGPAKQK
jgi:quercetin dioxygenase-like cupin family protein